MPLPTPVLLPLCVVAMAVLEGAFTGAQFGLVTGLVWALTYANTSPFRIPLLTFVGMASGAVTQYALRRSLSGCVVCATVTVAALETMSSLGGIITDLAEPGALLLLALEEFFVTMLCVPFVWFLFYRLYRCAGGKPV